MKTVGNTVLAQNVGLDISLQESNHNFGIASVTRRGSNAIQERFVIMASPSTIRLWFGISNHVWNF